MNAVAVAVDEQPMPVVVFPGLGADARMYTPQLAMFPQLRVVEWHTCEIGGSIDAFARRLASTLNGLGPVILGGSSFGGFVAWELAKYLDTQALVLLGSASTPRAVRRHLRWLLPAARFVPSAAHVMMKVSAPAVAPAFGAQSPGQRQVFSTMMRSTPTAFMTWATRAVASWVPAENAGVAVHRLHGRRDQIIAPPTTSGAVILEDAGHLPTLTHPDAVNAFLRRCLQPGAGASS